MIPLLAVSAFVVVLGWVVYWHIAYDFSESKTVLDRLRELKS